MAKAFVLINTEVGSETEIINSLKNYDEIKELYLVYGVYDIVARIEADSIEKLKEVVADKIRKIPKVKSTLTMIVIESSEKPS
ncbi:MAG: Lrp/AsnC ligand binding domain-containing protein [Sulfolobales archaeon]